jgi:hypothetical protein
MRLSSFLCGRLGVEICHHAASEVAAAISAAFDESVSSCNLQLCQQWDPAWGEAGPYLRLRSVYSVVSFLEGWAMPHLTPHDVMTMFMALAVLLGCAKLAAELMQKIGQPSILGEIFVGIFLGPTVLGRFRPHVYEALFPPLGRCQLCCTPSPHWGVVFFLLTAGLEIDLRSIFRQGKSALLVSLFGVAFPLGAGFLAASIFLNISVRKKERIRSSSRC